jgi:hypothetical protein
MSATIIEHSFTVGNRHRSVLLQGRQEIITLLIPKAEYQESDRGLMFSRRGSSVLCTYKGIKTVPERFKSLVDTSVAKYVPEGSYHAPFIPEWFAYGKQATLLMSKRNCAVVSEFRGDLFDLLGQERALNRPNKHIFEVVDGEFYLAK